MDCIVYCYMKPSELYPISNPLLFDHFEVKNCSQRSSLLGVVVWNCTTLRDIKQENTFK